MKRIERVGNVVVIVEGTPEEILAYDRLVELERVYWNAVHTNEPLAVRVPCRQCGSLGACFHVDLIPQPGVTPEHGGVE